MDARISVIVPAYNAAATITACVESLVALDPAPFEILVVDDGSTDGTGMLAARAGARVVRLTENLGPGLARNAGAAAVTGDILAFTDADCTVPRAWLANADALLASDSFVGVTGPYSGTSSPDLLPILIDHGVRFSQRTLPEAIESAITANLFVRRADFLAVGGFPEYRLPFAKKACFTNEDEELAYFLSTRFAKPLRWEPKHGPLHAYRPSIRRYFAQQAKYVESILLTYARFPAIAGRKTNYSKSSGGKALVATWLLLLAPAAIWRPVFLLAALPFFALHWDFCRYLLRAEKHPSRRRKIAFLAYPFQLLNGLAWTYGLVRGSLKAGIGAFAWQSQVILLRDIDLRSFPPRDK